MLKQVKKNTFSFIKKFSGLTATFDVHGGTSGGGRTDAHEPAFVKEGFTIYMIHTAIFALPLILSLTLSSCSILGLFRMGAEHELKDYEGKWYVIARMPNRYEDGLICTTSTYTFGGDGAMSVTNAGRERGSGRITSITSRIWIPDRKRPDTFRVQLFFTITRDYRLVYMNEDKTCAVIGSPSMHLMWIICRSPDPDEDTFTELKEKAAENGYDTNRLIMVEQTCGE